MTGPAPAAALAASQWGTISALDAIIHLPRRFFDSAWDAIWYPVDFLPLAASAQGIAATVQINDAAGFVCCGGCITVTDPANEATFVAPAPFTVQVRTGGQRSIVQQAPTNPGFLHARNLFGQNAQDPAGKWPVALYMPPNSQMTVVLNNLVATARNVRIGFYGFQVYGPGAAGA